MPIAYARASTLEQVAGFDSQVRELHSIGAEKIFKEQVALLHPVRSLKRRSIIAARVTCFA